MAEFSVGTPVATPRGRGVVSAVLKSNFNFPVMPAGDIEITASGSSPVYIVAFGGQSAPYHSVSLSQTTFDDGAKKFESGIALSPPVSEVRPDDSAFPDDLLEHWSEIGGTFETCSAHYQDEENLSQSRAESQCAVYKDAVTGTSRWRGDF